MHVCNTQDATTHRSQHTTDDAPAAPQATCNGHHATDDMQQVCQFNDSVEMQPMAETFVRKAARNTEGTSCFFLTAASCAVPTTRQIL